MTSQAGKQTTAMHTLPDNQTMKFGQLLEYNKRNIFLEKSYTNVVDKLFPDPFLKNQN